MRPSVSRPTGTAIGSPGVDHLLAAGQALGAVHGNGAHGLLAQMLSDFQHQLVALIFGVQRVQDLGQMPVELHVDHGAHDLGDLAGLHIFLRCHVFPSSIRPRCPGRIPGPRYRASAPEMISISSLVIFAWRVRL